MRVGNGEVFTIRKLHILYSSLNTIRAIKSRKLRWAGHVARMEDIRSPFKILTGEITGTSSFGRPRRKREDNARLGFKEI